MPTTSSHRAPGDVSLLDDWRALLPAAPHGHLDAAGRDLIDRWSEPQRHYHTLDHLRFMLSIVDKSTSAPGADTTAVRLAAWFHDAIYHLTGTASGERSNEAQSADLATEVLSTLDVAPTLVAEVVRLVLLTADHRVAADDPPGALLVDADLAILGTPPDQYRAYATAVRAEYAFVPDNAFRAGRAAVLRQLLDLDRLYHLPAHREAWDARARANMTAEIASLAPA